MKSALQSMQMMMQMRSIAACMQSPQTFAYRCFIVKLILSLFD